MENNDEFYQNLVTLLKLFKNRPYHLGKFLIENSALCEDFIENILKSDKINEIKEQLEKGDNPPIFNFNNINKMQDYFNSLTQISDKQDPSELLKELNIKMDELIKNEKFEEAARLRDYMYKKNIKRNK